MVAAAACASVEEILPSERQLLLGGQGDNSPVTFTASIGISSKTSIDEDRRVSWAAGDKITVFDAQGASEEFTVEDSCESFSFTSAGILGDGPYYAVAGYGSEDLSFDKDSKRIGIARPSASADGTFGSADLVASTTEGTSFTFHHVFALLKMSINAEDISSLTFAAKGVATTGNTLIGFDDEGAINAEYDYSGDEVSIENISGAGTYYIAVNPGTYYEGFTIYMMQGTTLMKVESDKSFTASVSSVVNFGTLDGGTPTYSAWELVTDASTLSVGDRIIIAASGYNYAISTTQNNNNRGVAVISKSSDKFTLNEEPGADVEIITLEAGSSSGTFSFNVGTGYLYAASSTKNYLKTQSTVNANASWKITVSGGVASITAQGTNTRNKLKYNPNNGSPLFSCYSSGQQDVAIYKKVYAPGEGPQMTEVSAFLEETEFGLYSYDSANDISTPYYQYAAGRDQYAASSSSFRLQDLADGYLASISLASSPVITGQTYAASLLLYGIEGLADGSSDKMFIVKKYEDGKAWLLEENGTLGFIISTK